MSLKQTIANAITHHQNNKLDQALSYYQKALAIDLGSIDALYGIATIYFQYGQFAKAKSYFNNAFLLEPTAVDIAYNYLLCLLKLNDANGAYSLLKQIEPHIPDDLQFAKAYVDVAKQLNATTDIVLILERQSKLDSALEIVLAQCYMKLERWHHACPLLIKLNNEHPNTNSILKALAVTAGKLRYFDQAISAYKNIINLQPSAINYLKFADLYLIAQKPDDATIMFNRAIALEANCKERYEIACKLARLQNNKEEIEKNARKLLTFMPTSSVAWQALQELSSQEDSINIAQQLENQISQMDDKAPRFDLALNHSTLAKAYESHENYLKAFDHFSVANNLQFQQLKQSGQAYCVSEAEQQFETLINLPTETIEGSKNSTDHIFIVGMPRSGTTLVNRLFSQHNEIESCNESNAIADCFESLLLKRKVNTQTITNISRNKENYQRQYREHTGINSPIIVDKMPHNFRFVGAILLAFPNAKIIQMRRDPLDLALSIYSQQFNDYHNYACSLPDIAHAIVQANRLMNHWQSLFPEQVCDVNYQALASTPQQVAKEMFEFCQLDWQDEYLNFYKENVASYTFSEVQVRKPINKGKIGFAKHYQEQMTEFTKAYQRYLTDNT